MGGTTGPGGLQQSAILEVRILGEFDARFQTAWWAFISLIQGVKKHSRSRHSPRSRSEMHSKCTRNLIGCCGEG